MAQFFFQANGRFFLLPAFLTVAFAAGFYDVLHKLFLRWGEADFSYCYLIIPLFACLLYERREADRGGRGTESGHGFKFDQLSWDPRGIVPIFLAVVLIFAGEIGSVETFMYFGVWGVFAGLAILFYGFRARLIAFPFLVLLFIVPLPPFINKELTSGLKLLASALASEMLMLSGLSVFREGNIIDVGSAKLQVVDACSGLRYLMPLLLLSLLGGYYFNRGWWRRGCLIFLAIPLSVLLNAFRIWITGIFTAYGYTEMARGFSHDFAGWFVFIMAGAVLYLFSAMMKRIGGSGHESKPADSGAPPCRLLKPAALTLAVALFFIGGGCAMKRIPSAGNLPQRADFSRFPLQIGEWAGERGVIRKEILDALWADDYVSAVFVNGSSKSRIHLLIPFYDYQRTMHTAHAPESCLLGGGWAKLGARERRVKVESGKAIPVQTMLMEKGGIKILATYFFFQRGRVITDPWLNKAYLFWDALARRRTDGALVRLEMPLSPGVSEAEAFHALEAFIGNLWRILPEYVPV